MKTKKKLDSNTVLIIITICLFIFMYAVGCVIYQDKGFGNFIDRYVAEEDRERVRNFVQYDTLVKKVPREGMYSTTFKRIIPNGEWIYIQLCFTRAVGPDGEENIVCACRDVDALIREENRRQELYRNAIKERDLDGLTGIRNRYCYEHFLMSFEELEYKNGFLYINKIMTAVNIFAV